MMFVDKNINQIFRNHMKQLVEGLGFSCSYFEVDIVFFCVLRRL